MSLAVRERPQRRAVRGLRAVGRAARETALTVGAVVGAVCLVSALAGAAFGVMPLVVESGSMSPTIDAGAVALARSADASDVRVGDIVSVKASNGERVTHRVAAIAPEPDGTVSLTLKGDANGTADAETYRVARAERVFFSIPRLGYALAWLGSPRGLAGCAALVAFALIVLFKPSSGETGGRETVAGVAVVALALGSWAGASTRSTSAYFTDVGTETSGAITAHTLAPPATATCGSALLAATITWPADPRYDYDVVLRRISNSAVVSTRQVTGTGNSTTYTGLVDFGLVVGAGTVDFQVEIRSKLATATTWQSSTVKTYSAIRVLAIAVGATATCTT